MMNFENNTDGEMFDVGPLHSEIEALILGKQFEPAKVVPNFKLSNGLAPQVN